MAKDRENSFSQFIWETRYIIVFYIFGDWITTKYGLQYADEGNSILASLIESYGIYSLLIVKLLFMVLLFWSYHMLKGSNSGWTQYIWEASKDAIGIFGVLLTVNNLLMIYSNQGLMNLIG